MSRERRQSEGVPTLECLDIGRGRHGVAIIVASPEVSASCLLAQAIGWADAGAPFALIAPVLIRVRGARLKCPTSRRLRHRLGALI